MTACSIEAVPHVLACVSRSTKCLLCVLSEALISASRLDALACKPSKKSHTKKINDVTSEQCGRLCLFIVHAHLGLTCRLCAFFQLRFRQGFFFPRGKRAGHRQNQLELLQLPMLYITLAPFQLQGLVKPLLPRLMRLSTKSGT